MFSETSIGKSVARKQNLFTLKIDAVEKSITAATVQMKFERNPKLLTNGFVNIEWTEDTWREAEVASFCACCHRNGFAATVTWLYRCCSVGLPTTWRTN